MMFEYYNVHFTSRDQVNGNRGTVQRAYTDRMQYTRRLPSAVQGLTYSVTIASTWLFCFTHLHMYWVNFVNNVTVLVMTRGDRSLSQHFLVQYSCNQTQLKSHPQLGRPRL